MSSCESGVTVGGCGTIECERAYDWRSPSRDQVLMLQTELPYSCNHVAIWSLYFQIHRRTQRHP
jgi:hypothetical protein